MGRAIVLNRLDLRSIATSGTSLWQVNASVTFDHLGRLTSTFVTSPHRELLTSVLCWRRRAGTVEANCSTLLDCDHVFDAIASV